MGAELESGAPGASSPHLTRQTFPVQGATRAMRLRQEPCVLWFTGLSGAGKSTLAGLVESALFRQGYLTYVLDGDNIRHGLCGDLTFTDRDRSENIRRVGEVSKLLIDAGLIVLTAFISPFRRDRALVRDLVGADRFVEIFVDAPLEVCEARDVKGLYRKARSQRIPRFTGIDSPYERPEAAELVLDTGGSGPADCLAQVIAYLQASGRLGTDIARHSDTTTPSGRL